MINSLGYGKKAIRSLEGGQSWGSGEEKGAFSWPCLNSVPSNCPTDTKSNLRGNGTGEVVSIRWFRDVSSLASSLTSACPTSGGIIMENYRPTLDWRCSSSMKKREREKREIASYKSRKSRRIKGIYHYPPPINQPNTSFFTKFPFDFPRISNYPKLIALQFPQLSNSVHLARSIIHSGLKNDQMEKSTDLFVRFGEDDDQPRKDGCSTPAETSDVTTPNVVHRVRVSE